jgi:hypothetical protein
LENGLEEKLVWVSCWKHTSYLKSINCLKSAATQQLYHLLWLTVSALISFPESFATVISWKEFEKIRPRENSGNFETPQNLALGKGRTPVWGGGGT